MIDSWTRNLEAQLAIDITQNFKESGVMRRRLKQMLLDKIEETRSTNLTRDKYDSPNWAYLQADAVGFERALKYLITVIEN